MRDENLKVPLSPKNVELLQKLVKISEHTSSMTIWITSCQGSWSGTSRFTVSGTRVVSPEDFERIEETIDCIPGHPILDLMARGYIWNRDKSYVVLNYELAKQRVKYEGRGKLGKWWMRTTNDWGRFAVDLAAVLGGIWALVDVIRMIIEALQ